MGEGLAAAREGPLNSSLSDLAPLCEAGLTVAWQVLGEANLLQDLSEGEMCSHRNATFGAHRAKLVGLCGH